jgi:hypothetical protein
MVMLALWLVQGHPGIYYYYLYWTLPWNCNDMLFLLGLVCSHTIGARYLFKDKEATKDFHRFRDLMGT